MPAEVTINKAELRAVLVQNRDGHRAKFLAAQDAYRKRVIDILDQRLADARAGRKINLASQLPTPEDYTSDYDREIRMLDMEVGETIVLDAHEFEQFVMDNWSWSPRFAATAAAYHVG